MTAVNPKDLINLANIDSDTLANSQNFGSARKGIEARISIAAADSNDDVWEVAHLPANAVLKRIRISNDAITGGTDYNITLATRNALTGALTLLGNAANGILADALDLSSASAFAQDGLKDVSRANRGKKLFELAGLTSAPENNIIVIVMKGITTGTAAGLVVFDIEYQ